MRRVLGTPSVRERSGAKAPPQVFGIGLARTGTKSLSAALNALGWHCVHQPNVRAMLQGGRVEVTQALCGYDAATDSSVAVRWRLLADLFPQSVFILTVRNRDAWLRSCAKKFRPLGEDGDNSNTTKKKTKDFDQDVLRLRQELYGAGKFDRDIWLRAAERHMQEVVAFFHRRGDRHRRLLIIDVTSGVEGWAELCKFLSVQICPQIFFSLHPDFPKFPWVTTHTHHLCASEFADTNRKVGLLAVRHGWVHYGGEPTHKKHVWVRRKIFLDVRDGGATVWIYVFRRPNTPLCDPEVAFQLSTEVSVHLCSRFPLPEVTISDSAVAPRTAMILQSGSERLPAYELRVDGLIDKTAKICALHLGCNNFQLLNDWQLSVLAGKDLLMVHTHQPD